MLESLIATSSKFKGDFWYMGNNRHNGNMVLERDVNMRPKWIPTREKHVMDILRAANAPKFILRPKGIEGFHLTEAGPSPYLWYPYLSLDVWWRYSRTERRTSDKGFPTSNGSAGLNALSCIRIKLMRG